MLLLLREITFGFIIKPFAFVQFSLVQPRLFDTVDEDSVECPVSHIPTHIPDIGFPSHIKAGCVFHESTSVPFDTLAVHYLQN